MTENTTEPDAMSFGPLDIYTPEEMKLRDYFAARAPEPPDWWWGNSGNKTCSLDAGWNWAYADAMLAFREDET